jgi:hypothetical protein
MREAQTSDAQLRIRESRDSGFDASHRPELGGFALHPAQHTIRHNQGVYAMILKLTTNNKASVWVNLSRILQMTVIDAQDGYPKTQIVMDNGAVIFAFETPDDIAERAKNH